MSVTWTKLFVWLFIFLPVLLVGQVPASVGYDFSQPTLLAELPAELEEISGLSLSPRIRELLAVQDEDGLFFRIDINTGQVIGKTKFWKDGDYEGIEAVGEDIWIVKSTGTLYRIRYPGTIEQEVTKFNGFLDEENDVEGLTYDPANNRLLLSCKSHFGGFTEKRSVFAFDLATNRLRARPVINLGRDQMQAYLASCPRGQEHQKICDFIIEREDFDLGPSAIAIHPITGQYFLTSSAGKLIIVLDARGEIEYIGKLDKTFFPQPEGLTFAPNGTLYVSTEAKKDQPARIYRLRYQTP